MMLTSLAKKMTRAEPEPFRIRLSVLAEIRKTVGTLPAEYGGVLGGRPEEGVVTDFHFDRAARRNAVSYTPDNELLNRLFAQDWNPRGVRVMGFVHSHPGLRGPSQGDLSYSKRILQGIPDLERLLTPIVISEADGGGFEILAYAIVREVDGLEVVALKMVVTDDEGRQIDDWEKALAPYSVTGVSIQRPTMGPIMADLAASSLSVGVSPDKGAPVTVTAGVTVPETFRRVVEAYDLTLMRKSKAVCIGTGGAVGYIEDLVRAGVEQLVLIDPDTVSETNLATQQTYRRDLGRPKVEAIADRIRDINPNALVVPLKMSLDEIDDQTFEFLTVAHTEQRRLSQSLICGLTDNFYAQARVNRLALHLGVPSLCAQVYHEGRGAEITFTHPDVTPACHRCVLSSRYVAYLDGGFKNTVTSDGTPIFATTRLNALKGFVAMALLHQSSAHPRWGNLLKRIGNRNLIQIRMDPDLASTVGLRIFDTVFEKADSDRIVFDETVWLPQKPEGPISGTPSCLDCGGTGNLRDSVGTFSDTRTMRK